MLTLVADTHGASDHRLDGQTLAAVREAETVIHAGDFTTEAVYDAFESEAADLVAVAGNNDEPALVERLPSVATVDSVDARLLVVHGHEHTETALSMLARQEAADVVVVGHSHRPELSELSGRLLVNPGSHADPRRYRPGYATVEVTATEVTVRLCHPAEGVVTETSRPL